MWGFDIRAYLSRYLINIYDGTRELCAFWQLNACALDRVVSNSETCMLLERSAEVELTKQCALVARVS